MHLVPAVAGLCLLPLLVPACGRSTGDGPPPLAVMDAAAVRTLAADSGKPVLVSLWATWCAPCLEEMPVLTRFQQEHPEVVVLGLTTDDPSMPGVEARLHRVFTERQPGYWQARLPPGGEDAFMRAFGRAWDGMLPKLVLVAPDGATRLVLERAVDASLLARAVVPLLGGAAP
ncbi:MAG: TlpA family protein disulfide reductase [Deltaproteobacteria bacterium]|nr:TlpA family protein disulfide reductase [Deltaproteobacteria bacterium]